MMRISDVCLAFPGLVFAMAIAAILGGGIQNAIIALAVVSWPKYSRIARSQTLALKEEPYIHAAILAGDSSAQILVRHVLPNMIGPVLVTAMLDIGTMMMELAGLSFLGLGAQIPMAYVKHDERWTKYDPDISMDGSVAGNCDFYIGGYF